ncbi:hypothetical protein GCM10009789_40550 [Kribbella sancticallisti]|uniref:Uncharacterized protein n=1 Tax=Kribbella sancticallisti TaxID=460087 RepID=A0ABN2DRU2_9ACTN
MAVAAPIPMGRPIPGAGSHRAAPSLTEPPCGPSGRPENPEQEDQRAIDHMRRTIALEGPTTVAAGILEIVPGAAGVLDTTANENRHLFT